MSTESGLYYFGMAKLLNLYECANKLGLPPKWLKQAAENGVVPCLRLAKRDLRFDPRAVQAAVEAMAARADLPSTAEGRL